MSHRLGVKIRQGGRLDKDIKTNVGENQTVSSPYIGAIVGYSQTLENLQLKAVVNAQFHPAYQDIVRSLNISNRWRKAAWAGLISCAIGAGLAIPLIIEKIVINQAAIYTIEILLPTMGAMTIGARIAAYCYKAKASRQLTEFCGNNHWDQIEWASTNDNAVRHVVPESSYFAVRILIDDPLKRAKVQQLIIRVEGNDNIQNAELNRNLLPIRYDKTTAIEDTLTDLLSTKGHRSSTTSSGSKSNTPRSSTSSKNNEGN